MALAAEEPADANTLLQQASDRGEIDRTTFEQILEMDDDEEEREFSRSIVFDFFEQAETTFKKMDQYLYDANSPCSTKPQPLTVSSSVDKDLAQLSALGHFLKGSSATLGLTKVKDSCEKIQHFGARKDETGQLDEDDDDKSLSRLEETIGAAKTEFHEVEKILRKFYHES